MAILAAGILWASGLTAFAAPVFPQGVSAGGESLAGMTAEEAGEAVREYIGSQGRQRITLNVDGQEVETTAEELGYHWTNEAVVEEAASAYAGGSLIHQYMMEKELAQNPVDLPLEAGVASSSVAQFCQYAVPGYGNSSSECLHYQREWGICGHRVRSRKGCGRRGHMRGAE